MKKNINYIYLAYGGSFVVIIIISIIHSTNYASLQKSNKNLENSNRVKNLILKVQANLIEAENSQRGYLITKDKELLTSLSETQKTIFKQVDSLQSLSKNNQKLETVIRRLKENISLRFRILYQTINYASEPQYGLFLKNIEKGKQIMQNFKNLANEIDELETKSLEKTTLEKQILESEASRYLNLILIISFIFQIYSFITIVKAFKRRREYQKTLENKIKELNVTNSEMEQITFVASHDLQEPLRKIRTFSDKLLNNHGSTLNNEGKIILEKISTSSRRMQELLTDVINYTRILKSEEEATNINLKQCCQNALTQLQKTIETKKASIKIGELPVIKGYVSQLNFLFFNLFQNSLKFSRPNVFPIINVSAETVDGDEINATGSFIKISISDNGIGFEKEFAKKIFIIFQRLHTQNSPFEGKGIGLAICKRIMINHNGYIDSTGETGVGATFNLYFPRQMAG